VAAHRDKDGRPRLLPTVQPPRDKEVAQLLSTWPIRVKFLIGLGLLLLQMVILAVSSLHSTYAYRSLVKDLSWRAEELPLSGELSRQVSDLRVTLSELRGLRTAALPNAPSEQIPLRVGMVRDQFRDKLVEVEEALSQYRAQLENKLQAGSPMADDQREWTTVHKIENALRGLREQYHTQNWALNDIKLDQLDAELENLQTLAAELPSHLQRKMRYFADDVRAQYRTMLVAAWIASLSAALVFALITKLSYQWIFRPLRVLIAGSRQVAAGQFGHRIHLETRDEMAELAEAMNDMTDRFQAIRDDLDRQVQERTKQVVRSEQLASVGFLAAGVAHEINNPLASIALCAESLESRIRDILDQSNSDHAVVGNYLRMIQSEAFRCKEITEKLLDFSRIGTARRQDTELGELVGGVIDMIRHLGKYQRKEIRLESTGPMIAPVNPQEIKQVVLNLLTNALDSTDEGGSVRVTIGRRDHCAELAVIDNGCGMSPEVQERVFEPFFTRRREGQGTGLGLSISYRIVADHGGTIDAQSPGPGLGATFRVRLPLTDSDKEVHHQYRAA
jgi:two-component system, NtrC family, sensor kinase